MKKAVILSAVAILFTYISGAQSEIALNKDEKNLSREEKVIREEKKEDRHELRKLEGKEVSFIARQQFIRDFGIPGVNWNRQEDYDVPTFSKDGMTRSAYYDFGAELVGTTIEKTFADLPLKAQEYINRKYSNYEKAGLIFFDDNEFNETDMVLYGKQFEDEDNYFIELVKDKKEIVLRSDVDGNVTFFEQVK
jgi:hypothetical protein